MSLRFTLQWEYVSAVSIFSFTSSEISFCQVTSIAIVFYDAPTPASGIFDDFLAIPTNQSDVKTRSLVDMVNSLAFLYPPPTAR